MPAPHQVLIVNTSDARGRVHDHEHRHVPAEQVLPNAVEPGVVALSRPGVTHRLEALVPAVARASHHSSASGWPIRSHSGGIGLASRIEFVTLQAYEEKALLPPHPEDGRRGPDRLDRESLRGRRLP